jgi:ubiquinone/menaquinone biosynthesis C-methylase UbiE
VPGLTDRAPARLDPPRSYEAVAGIYDGLARIWSLGRIDRAKCWQAAQVSRGDRCLFAGVGTGLDALQAARLGARVTAVDLSPSMLEATRQRLAAEGFSAELVLGDLFEHEPEEPYDVVIASFVLNVMGPVSMAHALAHLAAQTKPEGRLLVADFAPPRGGLLARAIVQASWLPVLAVGRVIGLASLHAAHHYAPALAAVGFEVVERKGFALWRGGPDLYEALVARRTH